MLIRKDVIQNIGLLDESYFMYVEDLDYCYMAIKNGYKLGIAHNSLIWHKVGTTSGEEVSEFSIYWIARNSVKFRFKKLNGFKRLFSISFFLILKSFSIFKWLIKNKKLGIKQLNGLIDGFNN